MEQVDEHTGLKQKAMKRPKKHWPQLFSSPLILSRHALVTCLETISPMFFACSYVTLFAQCFHEKTIRELDSRGPGDMTGMMHEVHGFSGWPNCWRKDCVSDLQLSCRAMYEMPVKHVCGGHSRHRTRATPDKMATGSAYAMPMLWTSNSRLHME